MKKISCDLRIGLVMDNGERLPLTGHLRFDPADPIAVTLVVRMPADETVAWTFARTLLMAGGPRPASVGDVRVQPVHGNKRRVMTITLTGPDGHADLELPSQRVAAFLRHTYEAVPPEVEAGLIDWDAEFGPLLGLGGTRTERPTDM
ncbi:MULTISPECIES: SsgA family sporulation/cell division regulator [unclassified Pseudofrankia]|uniref:SsgA family sporulation/cell division regulator n=1 Tax=unclassified Pseudofrankia TaxID=2994372 RepID=UPI0008D9B23F|nr:MULTISPECIES: SsgA family sporulation/cell division regulator [unclassified Pseudofrankia]MDT3445460.1 SsgA family sporulation/cell division regulator [Pseudofrankia sp. BMG5.37]OHV67505.1 hypothetical protein BCD48_35275 [Pseudofrankia sp. BMG5.36]